MAKKYPGVLVLVVVITGIIIADITALSSTIFLIISVVLFLIGVPLFYKDNKLFAALLGLSCLIALAAFSYAFRYNTFPPGHIIHYVDDNQYYTIYGTVDDWPVLKEHNTAILISVDSVSLEDKVRRGSGRLMINLQMETTSIQYGDRIYFSTKLYSIKGGANPSGFDYQRFLNLKEVFAVCYLPHFFNIQIDPAGKGNFYRLIDYTRKYITGTFKKTLEPNSAALASGFLIGETKDISSHIYQLFRDTGTLHLLAVSGSNVGLVILLFVFLLRASPYKLRTRTIMLLALIIVFSYIAYNQPSVIRASVMASLVLVGRSLQRRVDLNNVIAVTAIIILIVKPTELYDVGFQLSFATAWGLIYFVPKVTRKFNFQKWNPLLRYGAFLLVVSVIAQIVSLPMSAYYFQRMPIISFLSNLVIVPLVSIIVIGEVVLLLVHLILPIAGVFFGTILNPFINLTINLIELFGSDKISLIINYKIDWYLLLGFYLFLIFFFNTEKSLRWRRISVISILLMANIYLISPVLFKSKAPDITILSVSGGVAACSNILNGQLILSDMPSKNYSISEKIIVPFLESCSIYKSDIITLSDDFNTIQEHRYLKNKLDSSTGYLPESSKNIFMDICFSSNEPVDTFSNKFYGKITNSIVPGSDGLFLSGGALFYLIDSSLIIFAKNHIDRGYLTALPLQKFKSIVLIKGILVKKDFTELFGAQINHIDHLICSRLNRDAGEYIAKLDNKSGSFPKILNTSQVGAIKLVIDDGLIDVLF